MVQIWHDFLVHIAQPTPSLSKENDDFLYLRVLLVVCGTGVGFLEKMALLLRCYMWFELMLCSERNKFRIGKFYLIPIVLL